MDHGHLDKNKVKFIISRKRLIAYMILYYYKIFLILIAFKVYQWIVIVWIVKLIIS